MNCSMLKATKENIFQVTDSRVKSLVYAYTIIGWKSRKQNEIFFSQIAIASCNSFQKGNKRGRLALAHGRRGEAP